MTKETTIISRDNGYFEVVRFGCGCERRITTEFMQWGITESKRAANRERLAKSHKCQ